MSTMFGRMPPWTNSLPWSKYAALHDQPGVSLGVQRRLPDFRPESVPEGVLSALTAFPVHVEIVVAQRPHDPSPEPVRLSWRGDG